MSDEVRQVRNFILRNFLFSEDETALSDTSSLIASGVIDSTGVLELIMFIEQTFGIQVAEAEMIPANLESVDKVVSYVRRKKSGGGSGGTLPA